MNMPSASPKLVETLDELRQNVAAARREGHRIGLVPTMGALHEGHISLVHASKKECDFTVVTIFVNPTQFAVGEDLDRYPRTLSADLEKLAACKTDLVFVPRTEDVYRTGHATWVEVENVTRHWEGEHRPTHFRGVATIVLKLFNMVVPDAAFFGQKDYQQALVIRRMVADLDVPVEIRTCPIVRESDGLAMSSRNAYLSPTARQKATVLYKSLGQARELVAQGEQDAQSVANHVRKVLLSAGDVKIDYIALVDPDTLEPFEQVSHPALLALAVTIENTRLIDNEILIPKSPQTE